MSCDLPNTTFCVLDHGFGLAIARRLAESGARVLYHNLSYEKAFPTINEGIIGAGFPEIEWVNDFWKFKNDVDVFVFPDIYHQGLQRELRSQGFAVWGSGDSMRLELDRQYFLTVLKELGLDVPKYEVIVGVSALASYLKDKKDIFIKVSRWRGSWETKHWRNSQEDGDKFDNWAVKFGGFKEHVIFLCFAEIETTLELGCDTINVNGRWPEKVLHGIEKKDCAYLSTVSLLKDMPPELTDIMHAFSPVLQKLGYACQWSMEVRVAKEGNFFIDATTRLGLPSTASQLMSMKNFPEVVHHGAHGEFVEPDYEYQFTAECMVKISGEKGSWETVVLEPELQKHLKVFDCCLIDGQLWFPADEEPITEIGWLCSVGNTPVETAKEMNRLSDLLPDGADAAVEALADIIREVEEASKQGIEFTDQEMPPAEVVLEPT